MKQTTGIDATLDPKGKMGELTVWVGDELVVRKGFFKFPSKQSVLEAVQKELSR